MTGTELEQHKPMKIAFIDVYNRIPINSGGDWWTFQLLTDLARNNSVSMYYTTEKSSEGGYLPKDISFDTHVLPSRVKWGRVSTRLNVIRPDTLWDKAPIRDIEADCVFTLVYGYQMAAYIAKKNGAPLVLVMQNVEWEYAKSIHSPWHLPLRILENWTLNRVDAVITISPRDYDYAVKHGSRRVFYIPPQPDAHVFSPDGARYDYGGDRFNVLFYGSLDRHQNWVALSFIAKKLVPALARERSNGGFKVHVFGSGKPPDDLLSGTGINFIGAVSDPGMYIRGADAIIIPVTNPSGMKVRAVESLACGKPVVATPEAVQGLPEDLRAMTYVASTADEFVEALKGIRDGRLRNKTNASLFFRRMQKHSVDDVLSYVSKKRQAVKSRIALLGSRGIPAKYGGFETFAERVAPALAAEGREVWVSCEGAAPPRPSEYKGVKLFYFPFKPFRLLRRAFYETVYDVYSLVRASLTCDCMIMLGYGAGLFFFIPKLFRKKIAVNVDGREWTREKYNSLVKTALRVNELLALRYADVVIADSRVIQAYLKASQGRESTFISYGADEPASVRWDPSRLGALPGDLGSLESGEYFLVVARLERDNNISMMVKGFLAARTDKKLVIVGNFVDSSYERCVHAFIADHRCGDRVSFVGGVYEKDLLTMLRRHCCAYLHGHSAGGTNPSLLEAMITRNLIIAHDNPCNREVCDRFALFFNDPASLRTAIESVGDDPEAYDALRDGAFDRAKKEYTWDHVIREYEALLNDVLLCAK